MKERIKNLVFFMLFFCAVTLTVFLLVDKELYWGKDVIDNKQIAVVDGADYLQPYSYEINFAGENHAVLYDDRFSKIEIWDIIGASINRFIDFGVIEEIDRKKWILEKENRSVTVNFAYRFTFDEFRQLLVQKGSKPKEENYTIRFNAITIPGRETQGIYLADLDHGRYFVVKDIPITMEKISDLIEIIKAKEDLIDYWTIGNVLGLESGQSDTLVPVFNLGAISPIRVNKEIDLSLASNLNVKSYAGKMFGENFEFVNKNELNDGSILYIYGYGEKSYKFSADGGIEYIDKTGKPLTKRITFKDGLDIAMSGLSNVGEIPKDLYIKDFIVTQDERGKNLLYKFGYKVNGYPVEKIDKDYDDIEVEIQDGRLYRIYKNVRMYQSAEDSEEIVRFTRIIGEENVIKFIENYIEDVNSDIINKDDPFLSELNIYLNQMKSDDRSLLNQEVLTQLILKIESFKLEYTLVEYQSQEALLPTWQFDLGNTHYVINAYNFRILSEYKY